MKYRTFNTNFWYDGYVSELTKDEKLVFMYLLYNSRVDKTGIYELPDTFIAHDLDISRDELQKIKKKFEIDDRFYFYKGWIYIANFAKHNVFSTAPNIVKTFKKEFDAIPKKIKEYFFKTKKIKYKIPIQNTAMVTVTVKDSVIVIVNRVGGVARVARVEQARMDENIDPDEIPL